MRLGKQLLKSNPKRSRWMVYERCRGNQPAITAYIALFSALPSALLSLMQYVNSSSERTFGYLSTVESAENGYFGGYLVLSLLGRPLEFHCTAPVRPSRAQEILYGPTLQPYLLGEQICGALLNKAKLKPAVILTDCEAVLHVRSRSCAPIVLISARNETQSLSSDRAESRDGGLDSYDLEFAAGFEDDRAIALDAVSQLAQHVELVEPFARIHEAIREAQRIGGRGTNAHEQAA
jgi:hypothetical protein